MKHFLTAEEMKMILQACSKAYRETQSEILERVSQKINRMLENRLNFWNRVRESDCKQNYP